MTAIGERGWLGGAGHWDPLDMEGKVIENLK